MEICNGYGVTARTVHSILSGKTWGWLTGITKDNKVVPPPSTKLSASKVKKIVGLYLMGTQVKDIADLYGVSDTT